MITESHLEMVIREKMSKLTGNQTSQEEKENSKPKEYGGYRKSKSSFPCLSLSSTHGGWALESENSFKFHSPHGWNIAEMHFTLSQPSRHTSLGSLHTFRRKDQKANISGKCTQITNSVPGFEPKRRENKKRSYNWISKQKDRGPTKQSNLQLKSN